MTDEKRRYHREYMRVYYRTHPEYRAKSTLTENEFKEWSLRLFNHWLGEVHDEGRKR